MSLIRNVALEKWGTLLLLIDLTERDCSLGRSGARRKRQASVLPFAATGRTILNKKILYDYLIIFFYSKNKRIKKDGFHSDYQQSVELKGLSHGDVRGAVFWL